MKSRLVLIGLVAATLTIGCGPKRIKTLAYGTNTFGRVEMVGKDFIIVRFYEIYTVGYPYNRLEEIKAEADLLRIYRCDNRQESYCNFKIGDKVATIARGDLRRGMNPITAELEYLNTAHQIDIPLILYLDR